MLDSDENDYGRFQKCTPEILLPPDESYALDEALREIERTRGNAIIALGELNANVPSLVDPISSLCVYAVGLQAQLNCAMNRIEELEKEVNKLNELVDEHQYRNAEWE